MNSPPLNERDILIVLEELDDPVEDVELEELLELLPVEVLTLLGGYVVEEELLDEELPDDVLPDDELLVDEVTTKNNIYIDTHYNIECTRDRY